MQASATGPEDRTQNTVSSTMPASALIVLLSEHRCPDITEQLDLERCGRAPISGGGFGDIYQGALGGGAQVAIKCARLYIQQDDKDGHKVLKHAARELYAWSRFKHENVLELLGLAQFRDQMAMISPWMDNGTLLQYIKRTPTANRYNLCTGISEGVAYLHQNGTIHGDIKSGNVLISHEGVAKLADFGCTELRRGSLYFTTTTSDPQFSMRWAAPEILDGPVTRSKEADVYALGMTLLEATTGTAPFNDKPDMAVYVTVVVKKQIPERPNEFPSFDGDEGDRLWKIMVESWAHNPSDRPGSTVIRDRLKGIKCHTAPIPRSATPGTIPKKASNRDAVYISRRKVAGENRLEYEPKQPKAQPGGTVAPRRAADYESIFGRPTAPRPRRAYEAPPKDAYYPDAQYTQYHCLMLAPASGETPRPPVPRPNLPSSRRRPLVYPALLSQVADAFRQRITLSERAKDGLMYLAAFDGREAVEGIAHIIEISDRHLALLLGRALDAQEFFHDVTYDHRLRDSPVEIYQFSGPRPRPSIGWMGEGAEDGSSAVGVYGGVAGEQEDAHPLPSGVFTLLTECYSPTCSRDRLCYCSACPRRLEQQHGLSTRHLITNPTIANPSPTTSGSGSTVIRPVGKLPNNSSEESLIDYGLKEPGQLWVHSVSQEVVDSVSETEKKRQEAIDQVIYTERDFVRDLEYLRDSWMAPLKTEEIISPDRRMDFVQQVFWNIEDIIDVNTRLRDLLTKRQNAYPVVETIGDIFLELVPHFGPFVQYGKHQLYGKYEFEKEKASNPTFAAFVEAVERLPASRRLELNGYLTKPTTRLARYPLLLEVVLKHTPEDSVDMVAIPKAIKTVREFLAKVNEESGKTENRFRLLQLNKILIFGQGEEMGLKLEDEQRQLVYQGRLRRNRTNWSWDVQEDVMMFLFDHALLVAKNKPANKQEQLKVLQRPIPLGLLIISTSPEETVGGPRPRVTTFPRNSNRPPIAHRARLFAAFTRSDSRENGYRLTVSHMGKRGYSLTLWAPTVLTQRKWVELIMAQQEVVRQQNMVFDPRILNEGTFVEAANVNCVVPYDMGRRVVYATEFGVFSHALGEGGLVKVLDLPDVQQIDVLREYQLLIVLSEGSTLTFPLTALESPDQTSSMAQMKRIASDTSFFKARRCLGRMLVCIVNAGLLSSTFKVLELIDQSTRARGKPAYERLLRGGSDVTKLFKEFYLPAQSHSIHFLTTKLCVVCTGNFYIVDLDTLDYQVLLDPADAALDFIWLRQDILPVNIYRIGPEFLLCYTEFAFYVDPSGHKSRRDVAIYWEGAPTAFALHYPYIVAFDSTFIEIRHIVDGALVQVIRGVDIRCLFAENKGSRAIHSHPPSDPIPPQGQQDRSYWDRIIFMSDGKVIVLNPVTGLSSSSDASSSKA